MVRSTPQSRPRSLDLGAFVHRPEDHDRPARAARSDDRDPARSDPPDDAVVGADREVEVLRPAVADRLRQRQLVVRERRALLFELPELPGPLLARSPAALL